MRWLLFFVGFYALALGAFEGISSYEARFVQRVFSEDGSTLEYQGKIYAKAPHYGLWVYEKPLLKEVYIAGDEVVVYEPFLEQATFSKLQDSLEFLSLLKSAKAKGEGIYEAEILGQKYEISSTKEGMPSEIVFFDKLGNRTEIVLSHSQKNIKLDDELFRFTPKEGIDLIRR